MFVGFVGRLSFQMIIALWWFTKV